MTNGLPALTTRSGETRLSSEVIGRSAPCQTWFEPSPARDQTSGTRTAPCARVQAGPLLSTSSAAEELALSSKLKRAGNALSAVGATASGSLRVTVIGSRVRLAAASLA